MTLKNKRTRFIVVTTNKGGVGKTTCTFQLFLTHAMKNKDKKYLLIDGDEQSNLSRRFGILRHEKKGHDFSNLLIGDPVEDIIIESPLEEIPNVDLIPSSDGLDAMREVIRSKEDFILSLDDAVFENWESTFSNYDYVVIDTSPAREEYYKISMIIADYVINIIQHGTLDSVEGAVIQRFHWEQDREMYGKQKEEHWHMILNQSRNKNKSDREFTEMLEADENVKPFLFKNSIRDSDAMRNATNKGILVDSYMSWIPIARDIKRVIEELEEKDVL